MASVEELQRKIDLLHEAIRKAKENAQSSLDPAAGRQKLTASVELMVKALHDLVDQREQEARSERADWRTDSSNDDADT